MAAAPTSSCHPALEGHLLSPSMCFANPRCILALLLARAGLYLERLQKSSMTPILQLVLLGPQPQHGLSVPVELVVKVVQQGSPCPVLQEGQGTQPGLQGRSSDTDSCDTNPCDTSSCPLGAVPAPWSPCPCPCKHRPHSTGKGGFEEEWEKSPGPAPGRGMWAALPPALQTCQTCSRHSQH